MCYVEKMFENYLELWRLTADGDPIMTRGSRLLPVRLAGQPAMLKIATAVEEQGAGLLMQWWDAKGAARVLAHSGPGLLLERAQGSSSLLQMATTGCDDEASRILCRVAAQLHAPRPRSLPTLVPLERWFRNLKSAAVTQGGIFNLCEQTASALLTVPEEPVVLHGDIHHGNVLDFGGKGWLAIDPKGLFGERGFDHANIFCNPELATVTNPDRFLRQIKVVAAEASLDTQRLLQWVLAYAGLSAAWSLEDGETPDTALAVAKMAAKELALCKSY